MRKYTTVIRTIIGTALIVLTSLNMITCDKNRDVKQTEAARVALVDWLECEECTENQLETVLKHSKKLQPMLISTLDKGISSATRELYKLELEKRYDELIIYGKTHPNSRPTLTKQEFVNLYLNNLMAQYQTRAAIALSALGDQKSKQALQEALKKTRREDVRQIINNELQKMK